MKIAKINTNILKYEYTLRPGSGQANGNEYDDELGGRTATDRRNDPQVYDG